MSVCRSNSNVFIAQAERQNKSSKWAPISDAADAEGVNRPA